jgi:hypothetical protein
MSKITYKPGDRVRLVANGLHASGKPVPPGILGTVIQPDIVTYKNSGFPDFLQRKYFEETLRMFPVWVRWDTGVADQFGNDWVQHTAEEVEPA